MSMQEHMASMEEMGEPKSEGTMQEHKEMLNDKLPKKKKKFKSLAELKALGKLMKEKGMK